MFGTPRRLPRPVLLFIVFGIFLAIVGVTAMAQIVMLSGQYSTSALNSSVSTDAALVRMFVTSTLSPDDLTAAGPSPARLGTLESRLASIVGTREILQVEIRLPDGRIIASSRPDAHGATAAMTPDFTSALSGTTATAGIVDASASEAAGPALPTTQVLREYFPLVTDGQVRAVVAVWRDAAPILLELENLRQNIVLVTLSASLVAALALYFVFRSAQSRISRQAEALVDAVHRDTLTGHLNHGALVDAVALAVEGSRSSGRPFAIALLDIDNFRLLNENYGHAAGDDALLTVVDVLEREVPPGAVFGRYGPDELLIVVPADEVHAVERVLERVRAALVDHALQFDASERLPLTLSAGVCTFPDARRLGHRPADDRRPDPPGGQGQRRRRRSLCGDRDRRCREARSFDVLQGLIIAVDTKDRYTKRHSEDVARYGIFLAERLGLPPETIVTIRIAGLLHDVGKIGVPDQILRKPGPLTEEEYAVVKQHVALGDMIVRDLPGIEQIRAGVRHHHERWDGAGYLDRLAGEEIPLIARILAVGDAFSAMTSTRPYRKALDVREALTRLGDAAGTQLDERLVTAFIEGIETASDAPLPGMDTQPLGLWTPYRQVA